MRRSRSPNWLLREIVYSTEGCKQSSPTNTREDTLLESLLNHTRLLGLRDITEEIVEEWRYRHTFARWAGMRLINRWDHYEEALALWMGVTTSCEYRTREQWIYDIKSLDFGF